MRFIGMNMSKNLLYGIALAAGAVLALLLGRKKGERCGRQVRERHSPVKVRKAGVEHGSSYRGFRNGRERS
jgi:hypothetical protein